MKANNKKSYLAYLNKLSDDYNNTYYYSNRKKSIDADHSDLTKKTETNPKSSKSKVGDRVRTTKYKIIISQCYATNWSKEIFVIDSVLKTNPWTYKTKDYQ